jgi:hypothetical protein
MRMTSRTNKKARPERRLEIADLPELASLAETGKVMGLSVLQVRALVRSRRLEHVLVGRRVFVPKAAIPRFIAENTVQPCRGETQAPDFASSSIGAATTSAGPRMGAIGSAQRALQIAASLNSRSPNSSTPEVEPPGRVIPLKP